MKRTWLYLVLVLLGIGFAYKFQNDPALQQKLNEKLLRSVSLLRSSFSFLKLRRELSSFEEKFQANMTTLQMENERLRALLNYPAKNLKPRLTARVIGYDPSQLYQGLWIDRGRVDGVQLGDNILTDQVLVGRVVKLTDHFAQVLPITDPNSVCDVRIGTNGLRGMLTGNLNSLLLDKNYFLGRVEYLKSIANFKLGDIVVTSGLDQLFHPSLPIGKITDLKKIETVPFYDMMILPFVDYHQVQEVIVLPVPEQVHE